MSRWMIACTIGSLLWTGCIIESEPDPQPAAETDDTQTTAPTANDAAERADIEPLDDSGGPVELDQITLTAPEGWGRKPPSSGFVTAEFVLPRAEGDDEDGRLTVSTAGGSIEENIDRWRGQFGGKPDPAEQRTIEAADLEITVVDFSGMFEDRRGPFAPVVKRPGYRMLGAIIPVDGQLHFIKATGPQKTLGAHAEKFDTFVKSVKKNDAG